MIVCLFLFACVLVDVLVVFRCVVLLCLVCLFDCLFGVCVFAYQFCHYCFMCLIVCLFVMYGLLALFVGVSVCLFV